MAALIRLSPYLLENEPLVFNPGVSPNEVVFTDTRIVFTGKIEKFSCVISIPYKSITFLAVTEKKLSIRESCLIVGSGGETYYIDLQNNDIALDAYKVVLGKTRAIS